MLISHAANENRVDSLEVLFVVVEANSLRLCTGVHVAEAMEGVRQHLGTTEEHSHTGPET